LGGEAIPRNCGEPFPPNLAREVQLVATFYDEKGGAAGASATRIDERTMKLAVGAEPLVPEARFGQIDLVTGWNCNICGAPIQLAPSQTWMTTVLRAAGRFSAAQHGTRIGEDP
jgi:hypothetical protein